MIRVSGPVSFVETLKAAACGYLPKGPGMIALACSGGDAGLIADYSESNQLRLPALDASQVEELAQVLPAYANLVNPLDFTTAIWGDGPAKARMLDSALRSEADAAMLVLDYPAEFTGERKECDLLLELYCAALKRHGKTGFVTSAFLNCCQPAPVNACTRPGCRRCKGGGWPGSLGPGCPLRAAAPGLAGAGRIGAGTAMPAGAGR